jgi:sulfur-carrier protein
LADPGNRAVTDAASASGTATVVVHLPRSLVALFPGAERRVEARGATVADVIGDLDRQIPGIGSRVLDAGPSIRSHLNVFVAGERAGLHTPVPAGADVHIIPAVSGG